MDLLYPAYLVSKVGSYEQNLPGCQGKDKTGAVGKIEIMYLLVVVNAEPWVVGRNKRTLRSCLKYEPFTAKQRAGHLFGDTFFLLMQFYDALRMNVLRGIGIMGNLMNIITPIFNKSIKIHPAFPLQYLLERGPVFKHLVKPSVKHFKN